MRLGGRMHQQQVDILRIYNHDFHPPRSYSSWLSNALKKNAFRRKDTPQISRYEPRLKTTLSPTQSAVGNTACSSTRLLKSFFAASSYHRPTFSTNCLFLVVRA